MCRIESALNGFREGEEGKGVETDFGFVRTEGAKELYIGEGRN